MYHTKPTKSIGFQKIGKEAETEGAVSQNLQKEPVFSEKRSGLQQKSPVINLKKTIWRYALWLKFSTEKEV
jgi:hypothetical protein